jgi:hypothetical protein
MSLATLPQRFHIRILVISLLVGGPLLLIGANSPAPSPVYAVAALRTDLARTPGNWVGRTVRVEAVAGVRCVAWMGGPSPACSTWRPALLAPGAAGDDEGLTLVSAPQPALLAVLRRLPFAGRLLPGPPQIRWGALSTYRVRLHAAPARSCSSPPCYEALLLDAAP